MEPKKPRRASPKYKLGPGGVSREVYYMDRTTGIEVFHIHQLEYADGTLGGSEMPDPKALYVHEDKTEYHRHPGNRWWERLRRDPTEFFFPHSEDPIIVRAKKVYGAWRRWKCKRFGPIEANRRRHVSLSKAQRR